MCVKETQGPGGFILQLHCLQFLVSSQWTGEKETQREEEALWLLTALVQESHQSLPSESVALSPDVFCVVDVRATWPQTQVPALAARFRLLIWLLCCCLEGVGRRDGRGPHLGRHLSGILVGHSVL